MQFMTLFVVMTVSVTENISVKTDIEKAKWKGGKADWKLKNVHLWNTVFELISALICERTETIPRFKYVRVIRVQQSSFTTSLYRVISFHFSASCS